MKVNYLILKKQPQSSTIRLRQYLNFNEVKND